MRKKEGFTLLELMIVVIILGILATFLVPKIIHKPDEARVVKAKSDIKAIELSLKMYKLDNGNYPTTEQGLKALIEKPEEPPVPNNWKEGGYLDTNSVPPDPWGNAYIYRSPGDNGRDYEIISLGADGKEGGSGFNADIESWKLN
ncbi:MAG TPA: type II secretion system protein GspG [Deltaproteobacteria bacterium]|nr:MAG: type II secretion system protein GspG [bacterium]HDH10372.1 type II secretion system protein GspG [Deltaproteobacteria bacterium]